MIPKPGDMVRITLDAYSFTNGPFILEATQGSLARALSFEEYLEYYRSGPSGMTYPNYVKLWMDKGEQFPFLIVKAAPISQKDLNDPALITSIFKVGNTVILDDSFFQIIDEI